MVVLRAERDYKGEMEALSLEIEQVGATSICDVFKQNKKVERIIFQFLLGCGAEGVRAWEEEGGDGGELGQHAQREAGEEWTVIGEDGKDGEDGRDGDENGQ